MYVHLFFFFLLSFFVIPDPARKLLCLLPFSSPPLPFLILCASLSWLYPLPVTHAPTATPTLLPTPRTPPCPYPLQLLYPCTPCPTPLSLSLHLLPATYPAPPSPHLPAPLTFPFSSRPLSITPAQYAPHLSLPSPPVPLSSPSTWRSSSFPSYFFPLFSSYFCFFFLAFFLLVFLCFFFTFEVFALRWFSLIIFHIFLFLI